ncbi:hypothetical protein AX14_011295 [Amanita brunnescens Koide BX004]|nr:hypothetical protein AX14_011295 [Amanita brunnescens Koide BX004]
MAQIQNVVTKGFVANGAPGSTVVAGSAPTPGGHPPLAPGAAPPASSTIGGLPGLFINPNPAVPNGLVWGPVPFIWNFQPDGAQFNIIQPGTAQVWTQNQGNTAVSIT